MKKLLYITANSKPDELSSSKTVGRKLVNSILSKIPDIEIEELDLYREHIPQLKHNYFKGRSTLIGSEERGRLTAEEQKEVDRIIHLCDQFARADIYVLAAPMWSLSFPAPVKEYIDCIIQADKTVSFEDSKKPQGLLGDKDRLFIYVQSSGVQIPWIIGPAVSKGLNYVHDVMKFIGIGRFEVLLVDGTGWTEEERQEAIQEAYSKIDGLVDKI